MSDMSKEFAEARARGEAANMRDEVAALRLMLREVAQTNASGIDYALRCQRERDEARAERDEAHASWLLWQGKYGDAKREIDELRMGRDAARAEAEEAAAAYNAVAADLRRTVAERDELAAQAVDRLMLVASLRSELATTQRELHRLIHGTAIEGDGACEHEIRADAARAWSRLWHREARRLWREVQDLSGHLDDEQTARTAMLALAHARRQVLKSGYGHDVLDVARRAVEAVADAMLSHYRTHGNALVKLAAEVEP